MKLTLQERTELYGLMKIVRDRVDKKSKWCQFAYKDGNAVDLTTACERATRSEKKQGKLKYHLMKNICEYRKKFSGKDLVAFNDDPKTDYKAVRHVLRRTLESLRPR